MPPPRDTAPWMSAAGKTYLSDDGTIFLPQEEPPKTPERIQPYRKSFNAQVGKGALHYGIAKDPRAPDIRFGRRGSYCFSVGECLKEPGASGVAAVACDIAERSYATRKREPLGRGPLNSIPLPDHTQRSTFSFGLPSKISESAKKLIYASNEGKPPSSQVVGQSKLRNYDWASVKIDPTQFRFGQNSANNASTDGTVKCLVAADVAKPTKLVPLTVANSAAVSTKNLGHVRNLGFGDRKQGFDHSYGKTYQGDQYGARMLLASCGAKPEDDEVLGRPTCKSSMLRRLRTQDHVDEQRSFGCPTIRKDLSKPKYRKVTNVNNYGDDANASSLLYPSAYVSGGVDEDAFHQSMSIDQVKKFVANAKIDLTAEQIEQACRRVLDDNGNTTIAQFRRSVNELGF